MWIGVVLVAASVVVGARLLAAADDTVTVWALAGEQGAGATLESDDVVAVRLRFDDDADLGLYFPADEPLPDDAVLLRPGGPGELLARSAVGDADASGLQHVPLEVLPQRLPPSVATGSVVDVFLDDAARRSASADDSPLALEAVTVVDVPPSSESWAATGNRQVVVAVDPDLVADFLARLGALDQPVLTIVQRER